MSIAYSRPPRAGRLFAAVLAVLALAPAAWSQTPEVLTHQARLGAAFDVSEVDRVAWSADRDVPQFLAGRLGQISPTAAPSFVRERAALFGFADEPELRVTRADTDELGRTHVRMQQTVAGVPVWGAESALHLERDGTVYAWGGDLHPDAEAVELAPSLDAGAAVAVAAQSLGPVRFRESVPADALAEAIDWSPESELVVLPTERGYRAAFHVTLYVDAPVPANWEVFVDAQTGEVLNRFNSIHTSAHAHATAASGWAGVPYARQADRAALSPVFTNSLAAGTGTSLFGGSLPLTTLLSGGTYYLYDNTRGPSYIRTMTAGGGTSLPGSYVTDADNSFPASAAVDAHYGAVTTFDYYKNTHGRSSYNGSNATITSTVNYDDVPGGAGYNNAFWNGQQMVYGDGDGQTFRPLVSLDIAAHELTHAVTGSSAGLIYQNESGALNEAVSDIMAVMVDRDDYKIGENSYTPGTAGDALRYLDNPPAGNQPDNYADRYIGSQDNGGVHINSGIANKQAYLMIAGGTFRGVTVQAAGRAVTEKVWYRALTTYFTASTNFAGARQGTIQAATDLYGASSAQVASVTNAWAAVGVGSGTGGGDTGGGAAEWRYETKLYESRHNYRNNTNETKTYSKPGAQQVAMYFERFETEANYDLVRIKDAGGAVKATYSGTKAAFWAIVDGAQISLQFTSDGSVVGYGYRVTRVAYFSDRALIAGGEVEGEPLGFVPQALAGDVLTAAAKPAALALEVGPNPATADATVTVSMPDAGRVRVSLFDMLGREVAVAHDGVLGAGRQPLALRTGALPAGVYVVVLETEGERMTRQLTVVR